MRYYWLVFGFFVIAYLLPLGGRPMITPDEFRYAEIPREMIASGDYVVPRLLEMRYFEKPVMGYWLTAGSFQLFGENAFALRLPVALSAGLAALLLAILVQQALRDEKVAALSAALLLSSGLFYGVGTFAVLDIQLTALITGVLGSSYLAMLEPRFNRRKILLLITCGLFAGLAFLTKGFLAFVVPGLAVLGFIVWERRWKALWQLPWIPLAAALLVVLPWAWLIHRAEPDFWRYFIMEEHWHRFAAGGESEHSEPFWYFVPALLGGVFPAALLALGTLFLGRRLWSGIFRQSLYRFCACAVVLPFLFFSVSSGKLATYILPCFPPLAVIGAGGIAAYFRTGQHGRTFEWCMTFFGLLIFLAGIAAVVLGVGNWIVPLAPTRWMIMVTGVVAMMCGGALLHSRKAVWRIRLYQFFVAVMLLCACGGWVVSDELLGDKTPEKALLQLAQKLEFDPEDAILVTPQRTMHAVAWTYRRADVRLLGSAGELDYGDRYARQQGETPAVLQNDEFAALLMQSDRPEVVFLCRDRYGFPTVPADLPVRSAIINQMAALVISPPPSQTE